MSFHSLLNSIIDSQSVTKNSLINETGIDRSSFYQILSGKRIPTKDQITSIIRQLDISATDEMALYDALLSGTAGRDQLSLPEIHREMSEGDWFSIYRYQCI